MKKEWTECYEYFKNRKFIEKPPKTLVNLKQTTINLKNANCSMDPKSMSHPQEDSEEPEEQETGRTSKTAGNSCGQRDSKICHPRDSV